VRVTSAPGAGTEVSAEVPGANTKVSAEVPG
jgi:hypothetical protein